MRPLWRSLPRNTQAFINDVKMPGKKINKEKFYVLLGANALATHRLRPVIVGKALLKTVCMSYQMCTTTPKMLASLVPFLVTGSLNSFLLVVISISLLFASCYVGVIIWPVRIYSGLCNGYELSFCTSVA